MKLWPNQRERAASSPYQIAVSEEGSMAFEMLTFPYWLLVLLILGMTGLVWLWCCPSPIDNIHFTNGGGSIKAVLVDGTLTADGLFKNDATARPNHTTTASDLPVGDYNNSVLEDGDYDISVSPPLHDPLPHTGEVIAFADDSPPLTVTDVDWKIGNTTIDVTLPDNIQIPIKIWIVNSSSQLTYADIHNRAIAAVVRANQIYQDEKQGITLRPDMVSPNYEDKTSAGGAGGFTAFTCSLANPSDLKSIQTVIGHAAGMINVYYVATVESDTSRGTFSPSNGFSCIGTYANAADVIAIGIEAGEDLLVHELGHALSNEHVGDDASYATDFDNHNVMHEAPDCTRDANGQWQCGRAYLTEGQTYRQVANTPVENKGFFGSALNDPAIYNRSLPFRRYCGRFRLTDLRIGTTGRVRQPEKSQCPPIEKRLWADGVSFGPN